MKNTREVLLLIFVLAPAMALAHGEDVLVTIGIQIFSAIVFFILLLAIKFSYGAKIIMFIVYFLTVWLTFCFIDTIPYNDNRLKINLCVWLIPVATVSITYFVVRYISLRNKK